MLRNGDFPSLPSPASTLVERQHSHRRAQQVFVSTWIHLQVYAITRVLSPAFYTHPCCVIARVKQLGPHLKYSEEACEGNSCFEACGVVCV